MLDLNMMREEPPPVVTPSPEVAASKPNTPPVEEQIEIVVDGDLSDAINKALHEHYSNSTPVGESVMMTAPNSAMVVLPFILTNYEEHMDADINQLGLTADTAYVLATTTDELETAEKGLAIEQRIKSVVRFPFNKALVYIDKVGSGGSATEHLLERYANHKRVNFYFSKESLLTAIEAYRHEERKY